MLRVGLTGGIGSGKTTVARIFGSLGIPIYLADEEAKHLMNTDPLIREQLLRHFGAESYDDSGQLNRKYIASIVFADKDKLGLLNSLTHPATIRHANEWMKRQDAPYTIKEAALIFESGSSEHLDFIIGVYAPAALRIQRTMEREGISREEVLQRMSRQIEEEMKMKLCDVILINDEQQLLLPQVLRLHQQLVAKE